MHVFTAPLKFFLAHTGALQVRLLLLLLLKFRTHVVLVYPAIASQGYPYLVISLEGNLRTQGPKILSEKKKLEKLMQLMVKIS